MDVILEVFDTFIGDRLYANLLPALTAAKTSDQILNATYNSLPQAPNVFTTPYTYHPASSYISLEPSDFAYMSQWSRDHIVRQAISLFFITW